MIVIWTQQKNRKKLFISICLLLIIIPFFCSYLIIRSLESSQIEVKPTPNIIEKPKLDFSHNNDNSPKELLEKELKQEYSDPEYNFSLRYPTDWTLSTKHNCLETLSVVHKCVIFSKEGYKFSIFVEKGNKDTFDARGGGLISTEDLIRSYKYHVDGIDLLRNKYINGTDEDIEDLSIVMSIVNKPYLDNPNYLGYSSFYILGNDNLFEIIYSTPSGAIKTEEDLNNSPFIKTMDLILQSIVWNNR
jgi:hypothetical protein